MTKRIEETAGRKGAGRTRTAAASAATKGGAVGAADRESAYDTIAFDGSGVVLGAFLAPEALAASRALAGRCTALHEAARAMLEARSAAPTNLYLEVFGRPADSPLVPPLLALGAELEISTERADRWVPLHSFHAKRGEEALVGSELFRAVRLADPPPRSAFLRHGRPNARRPGPFLACAAHLERGLLRRLAIALGGVADRVRAVPALEAFRGEPLTDALIAECAVMAEATARRAAESCGRVPHPAGQVLELAKRCLARLK